MLDTKEWSKWSDGDVKNYNNRHNPSLEKDTLFLANCPWMPSSSCSSEVVIQRNNCREMSLKMVPCQVLIDSRAKECTYPQEKCQRCRYSEQNPPSVPAPGSCWATLRSLFPNALFQLACKNRPLRLWNLRYGTSFWRSHNEVIFIHTYVYTLINFNVKSTYAKYCRLAEFWFSILISLNRHADVHKGVFGSFSSDSVRHTGRTLCLLIFSCVCVYICEYEWVSV